MFNRLVCVLAGSLGVLSCSSALAWSASGHEAVAMIAWNQLDAATRAKMTAVLDAHPLRDRDLLGRDAGADREVTMFMTAATWPDMVKTPSDPMHYTDNHPQWHYIDFPVNENGVSGPQPEVKWDRHSDPENLEQAMAKLTAEFADPATKPDRRAVDLCWIEHLVGDIHQPLHATSLYSKQFPDGDKGGNSFLASIDGHTLALHGYWDGLEGRGTGETYIKRVAKRTEAAYPPSHFGPAVEDQKVDDWAQESFKTAKHVVYDDGHLVGSTRADLRGGQHQPTAAPADYDATAHKTADERIALAGYRLAALLTKLSVPHPPAATLP